MELSTPPLEQGKYVEITQKYLLVHLIQLYILHFGYVLVTDVLMSTSTMALWYALNRVYTTGLQYRTCPAFPEKTFHYCFFLQV